MKVLNVLYLEDDETERKEISRWIAESWESLNRGIPFTVNGVSTLEEAKQWLADNVGKCDLFLVDLSLGSAEKKNVQGVEAINHVQRKNYRGIAIIVVSQLAAPSVHKAMQAGAHGFLSKEVMANDWDNAYVLGEIERTLGVVGKCPWPVEDIAMEYDRRDLALSSLVETVGEDTLKVLVLLLATSMHSEVASNRGMVPISAIRPSYVRPGLSGSVVVGVEIEYATGVDLERQRVQQILLKCDRDLGRLQNEFKNERRLRRLAQSMRIEYVPREPKDVQCAGWYACATRFQTNAKDFASWLYGSEGKTRGKQSIERCLSNLFSSKGGLGQVYRETARRLENDHIKGMDLPPARMRESLSARRRALAFNSINELSECAKRAGMKVDESVVIAFLHDASIASVSAQEFTAVSVECWNHGDLHSRNILIDLERAEATIIDPAEIDWGYVGTDVARLCVDLFMSVLDSGVDEYFWGTLDQWRSGVRGFIDGTLPMELKGSNQGNRGAEVAITWLRRHWPKITENEVRPIQEWEFRLLVAVEFIRFTTFFSVPMPKRVLALLCASDAITSAAESIPPEVLRGGRK